MTRREPPEIRWRAVLIGGAVALGAGAVLSYVLGAGLNTVAGFASVAAGAATAGLLAPTAGGFHGGLVAALWIVAEALTDPLLAAASNVVADTASTLLLDVLRLAVGVGAGWLASRTR